MSSGPLPEFAPLPALPMFPTLPNFSNISPGAPVLIASPISGPIPPLNGGNVAASNPLSPSGASGLTSLAATNADIINKTQRAYDGCSKFTERLLRHSLKNSIAAKALPNSDGIKKIPDEVIDLLTVRVNSTIELAVYASAVDFFFKSVDAVLPSRKLFEFLPRLLNPPICSPISVSGSSVESILAAGTSNIYSPQTSLLSQTGTSTNALPIGTSGSQFNRAGNKALPASFDQSYWNRPSDTNNDKGDIASIVTCGICGRFTVRGVNVFYNHKSSNDQNTNKCKCEVGGLVCSACLYKWAASIGPIIDIAFARKALQRLPIYEQLLKATNDTENIISMMPVSVKRLSEASVAVASLVPNCPFNSHCSKGGVMLAADASFLSLLKVLGNTSGAGIDQTSSSLGTFICPRCYDKSCAFSTLGELAAHMESCIVLSPNNCNTGMSYDAKPEALLICEAEESPVYCVSDLALFINGAGKNLLPVLNALIVNQDKIHEKAMTTDIKVSVVNDRASNLENIVSNLVTELPSTIARHTVNVDLKLSETLQPLVDRVQNLQRLHGSVAGLENNTRIAVDSVKSLRETITNAVSDLEDVKKKFEDAEKKIKELDEQNKQLAARCSAAEKKSALYARRINCGRIKSFIFFVFVISIVSILAFYPERVVDSYDRLLDLQVPNWIKSIPAVQYLISRDEQVSDILDDVE